MTTIIEEKEFSSIDEINILINARRKGILIETYEESRLEGDLRRIAEDRNFNAVTWSVTSGGFDLITGDKSDEFATGDPIRLMNIIQSHTSPCIFILKDFHDLWTNIQAKRALRDLLETQDEVYKPIILVSPFIDIPAELEKVVTSIQFDLPSRKEVIELLEGIETYQKRQGLPVPEGREREAIIHSLVGMTTTEISDVLKKSVVKHRRISLEEITSEKEQVIRKTGLLEYITKLGDMENVGGMDVFKDWLSDARYAFDPAARELGIDPVRGAVAAGIPGSGKSLLSKSIAHMWNLPLLKMNMSQIMGSRVGESEKNIDRALKLAEDVSPCVLWIDEMEKALSGVESSGSSDSGTLSRVVQSLLTWLSDKESPVFVFATANDITKLPPELTRAGRFDEIFFVSLPSFEERKDILEIHLNKRGYITDKEDKDEFISLETISFLSESTDGFTGAEIEQVVAESGRRAYAKYMKKEREKHYITKKDLEEQISEIIPMSKRNPEVIRELREWAKTSAKCASSHEHKLLHGTKKKNRDLPSLFDLENL